MRGRREVKSFRTFGFFIFIFGRLFLLWGRVLVPHCMPWERSIVLEKYSYKIILVCLTWSGCLENSRAMFDCSFQEHFNWHYKLPKLSFRPGQEWHAPLFVDAPTHAIFSLRMRLLLVLFLITGLSGLGLSQDDSC